jgi:hypothetical protein
MHMADAAIPAYAFTEINKNLMQLTNATKAQNVATLAASLIAASGRPHSIQEAMDLCRNIDFAMHPAPGSGAYIEWAKTKDQTLNKAHS